MYKIFKKFIFSLLVSLIALIIIIIDISGNDLTNLLIGINPLFKLMLNTHYSLIVDSKLQLMEPSSAFIHYTQLAYLIHFASFVLLGLVIDVIKNKLGKQI